MSDKMTPQQRHECMSHIHAKDTGPELLLRGELWRRGYRYRLNDKKLPGKPDVVLPKYRTAIFVNGCFWHGHNGCSRYVVPKTNTEFWLQKITCNQERDFLNIQRLEYISWNTITVWECELSKSHIYDTMVRIEDELKINIVKWNAYITQRRQNRLFAIEQTRRSKEIAAIVETELNDQFNSNIRIRHYCDFEME